jgi:hypothetical protein
MYLIFNSEQEALDRSDQAGADKGLWFHAQNDPKGTRYLWSRISDYNSDKVALIINDNVDYLTEEEQALTINELPENWGFIQI